MRISAWGLVVLALSAAGCGGSCPQGAAVARHCSDKVIPVGHWAGEWETYPIDNPDFVRSGNIELVIAQSGKLSGNTSEDDNPDTGTLSGSAKAGGEFEAQALVSRSGFQRKYSLTGTYACDAEGFAGVGSVTWEGGGKGNMKFRVHDVP